MSITLGIYTTLSSSSNKTLSIYKAILIDYNITLVKPNFYKDNVPYK